MTSGTLAYQKGIGSTLFSSIDGLINKDAKNYFVDKPSTTKSSSVSKTVTKKNIENAINKVSPGISGVVRTALAAAIFGVAGGAKLSGIALESFIRNVVPATVSIYEKEKHKYISSQNIKKIEALLPGVSISASDTPQVMAEKVSKYINTKRLNSSSSSLAYNQIAKELGYDVVQLLQVELKDPNVRNELSKIFTKLIVIKVQI